MIIQERLVRLENEMSSMKRLMWVVIVILLAQLGVDVI